VSASDIYPRPSREEIAARVAAGDPYDVAVTPRDPDPEPGPPSAVANFAVHLSAKLRALGMDAGTLAERSGLSQITVTRAVSGTSVSLEIAEKLAVLTGGYLAAMIGPYVCGTCAGEPPAGFACLECGTEARAA
jgi:hypothetical protein